MLLTSLFQREAASMIALQNGTRPDFEKSLRLVPMFETLDGIEVASDIMQDLLSNEWYRNHIK